MKLHAKKLDKNLTIVEVLKLFFQNGVDNVIKHNEIINKLNVFPIPDGDTGTNLTATLLNGLNTIKNKSYKSPLELCQDFSKGLLMGAKGNSGIIFTQIIRGFTKGLSKHNYITFDDLNNAFYESKTYAYRSVHNPIEGTMLSVIKYCARYTTKKIKKMKSSDFEDILKVIVADMHYAVDETPNQLPVLKEANVVDSGAFGLMCFFEGMYFASQNIFIHDDEVQKQKRTLVTTIDHNTRLNYEVTLLGYCTEFVIQLFKNKLKTKSSTIKKQLEKNNCNSIVIILDDDILKIHLHTFKPYQALKIVQIYGEYLWVKIENMTLQNNHFQEIVDPKIKISRSKEGIGILVIISGKGWLKRFKEFSLLNEILYYENAREKPNTSDILKAIRGLNYENVIIITNSPDTFLTIYEAIKLADDQKCILVKAKNNGQSYLSLLNYMPENNNIQTVYKEMINGINSSKVFSFTFAEKNSQSNGMKIYKNNYICCYNNKIISANSDLEKIMRDCISANVNEETELITIFKEEMYEKHPKILNNIVNFIEKNHPIVETEIFEGLLKNYSFTFIIE